MHNLSVPAALEAWIDRVTFPGALTGPDTGDTKLDRMRVVVVAARGGACAQDSPLRHMAPRVLRQAGRA